MIDSEQSHPKQVLIIDDEETIQTVVRFGLKLSNNWGVCCASSGIEGLTLAAQVQPDVILLDVMMPEMDGIATLKTLQSSPSTQNIPVILLTAKAQTSDRRQFQTLGVSGIITKPFNSLNLAAEISTILHWTID
jgi:CheY-like chemotaxis protein